MMHYYEALNENLYSRKLQNGLTVTVVPRPGFSVQQKIGMDRAEIGDKIGKLFGKSGAGNHLHRQTVL